MMFLDAIAQLEAQQDEILAQAHAVLEYSLSNSNVRSPTSMKSPADASSFNENRQARSRRLEDQAKPDYEKVIDDSRPSEKGMRVDSNGEENR